MTLCMNHWLCFNTVVEHIFTLTGATWSSRNVTGPAQFMSYWPSSKGLKHLAHMNKESRGNILESTLYNIFVPQHKNSVLNADVSSKRGSSSQAPVLKKYSRPPKVMNVLKTAPQLRISFILGRQTSSGAKRWIGWKIDTNKGSKFKTTDDGWCWCCTLHHISTSFFVFFPLGNNVFPLFIKWVSRVLTIQVLN